MDTVANTPNPLSEGAKTSEHDKVTRASDTSNYAMIIGIVTPLAAMLKAADLGPQVTIAIVVACTMLFAIGFIAKVWLARQYSKDRTALKIAGLNVPAAIAKLILLAFFPFVLAGCAGSVGNADPSLNQALQGAQQRFQNYKTNRDAVDNVEDAALADSQNKAIAYDTQTSITNAQLIATQKNLPVAEQIQEIGRIYAVAQTERIRVAQNLSRHQQVRASFDSDYNAANALMSVVQAANSSTPVSATSVFQTAVNALIPVAQQQAVSLGVSTTGASTPAITPSSNVASAPRTVAAPVPEPAGAVVTGK